jgi:glutamate racemase
MPKIKIGVFDSGVGGLSVVKAIHKELPDLEIVYKDDKIHVPYGNREVDEIHRFVKPIFQSFIDEGCQVIVVACNTVTTNLIEKLRQEFSIPMTGMEPMVGPAAKATKTETIAVCATSRTLQSGRYKWLKQKYANGITVLEPDCDNWAKMIENNTLNRERVAKTIEGVCDAGADQIVLGCTHFHWIEQSIKDMTKGKAEVIQPEEAAITQLRRVLARLP